MGEKGSEAGGADDLTSDEDAALQRAMDSSRNSQFETELSNELKREADSRDALIRDPK